MEEIRSKVKRLVIECDWDGNTKNPLYRKELRGCKDQHNDECRMNYPDGVCMKHCIKADFFQLVSCVFCLLFPEFCVTIPYSHTHVYLFVSWFQVTKRKVYDDL